MFNPEKLLGGLLRSGMSRGSGMGSLLKGGAALGLVGVAMEAVEHFMNRPQSAPPPAPGPAGGMAPPPPPPVQGRASAPPPLPGAQSAAPPIAPPAGTAASPQYRQPDAVLLIRAMIAAANADGTIDARERSRILDQLKSVNLSSEEHAFIVEELLAPKNLDSIAAAVDSAQTAEQVYMVSLLAIEIDTDVERDYLKALAGKMKLEPSVVDRIHTKLGIAF